MAPPLSPGPLAGAALRLLCLLATLAAASSSAGRGALPPPSGLGSEATKGRLELGFQPSAPKTAEETTASVQRDRVPIIDVDSRAYSEGSAKSVVQELSELPSPPSPVSEADEGARKHRVRSARYVTASPPSSDHSLRRHRHNRLTLPSWLDGGAEEAPREGAKGIRRNPIEAGIEAVFRSVAYRDEAKDSLPTKEKDGDRRRSGTTSNRYERTTVLSETPVFDYVSDGRGDSAPGWPPLGSSSETPKPGNASQKGPRTAGDVVDPAGTDSPAGGEDGDQSSVANILEIGEYDDELYNLYEGHYVDFNTEAEPRSDISRRGDTFLDDPSASGNSSAEGNNTSAISRGGITRTGAADSRSAGRYRPISRLSWFDALLCSNRNMGWMFVNFLLGFLFLLMSLLAPYRLLRLRACTRLLPRTHYVAVHLLVFVAASFKAVYLFHLTFGGQDRLPLVLLLILTNTSVPCWSSAFLLLILMMFLAADVQVYKPKLMTVYNISILIVMKLALCFIADVIVGSAHSKSVLILSRLMLICVAATVIVFYVRKHQRVVQVAEILKREFQGEMKLLVVPAQENRQMGIKHILRNRLYLWCKVTRLCAGALATLCFIHFFHSIFLISSQVPAWAWWIFHVCGCLTEFLLGGTVYVAAALTQRYDEKLRFIYNFFVPSGVFQKKGPAVHKERNGNAIYQRVSYSSGTESTQYVSGAADAGPVAVEEVSGSPRVPRRRGATVRRSATFSHTPQDPRMFQRPYYQPTHVQVARSGSTSQIPCYSSGSVSFYGNTSMSHVPVYSPPSTSSMLVHEDGFVRIKTQLDRHEAAPTAHESLTRLHDPRPSHQHMYDRNQHQANALGRQESFYESLSRRRGSHRTPGALHKNIEGPDHEYQPARNLCRLPDLPQLHYHGRHDADRQSLYQRRASRDPMLKQMNNMDREERLYHSPSLRRSNSRDHNFQAMNNLDRADSDYQNLSRRKLSREDNNDPLHLAAAEPEYQAVPSGRRPSREGRSSVQSPYDKHGVNYYLPSHHGSPSARHKVSNYSIGSPVPPEDPSATSIHNFYKPHSPSSPRREAHFPKLFSDLGSTSSLKSEELDHRGPFPRTNPVRRNHSSAGYFPSRNLALAEISEDRRFSSLRLSQVRKRQPGYAIKSNTSKLLNKYIDLLPKRSSVGGEGPKEAAGKASPPDSVETSEKDSKVSESEEEVRESRGSGESETPEDKGASAEEGAEGGKERENDPDWALELIKSSSMLTNFYSLESPQEHEEE